MIKIPLIIKQNSETVYTFETDKDFRFIVREENGNESVILENVTAEFDGICDDNGRMHFLIQSLDGSLIYIKHDNNTWKKYIVFKSKSKLAKMSDISLTWKKGVLCGFYTIEYNKKTMLIKHIFSSSNLYATPEVIDVLDIRKTYCICTDKNNMTVLYYKNIKNEICVKSFDSYFSYVETKILDIQKPIYDFLAVSDGNDISFVYTTEKKGYTVLLFSSKFANNKVITFGVPKNTQLSMININDYFLIQWTEGDKILYTQSYDGGQNFSKPVVSVKHKEKNTIREKGLTPGKYYSGSIALSNEITNICDKFIKDNFSISANNERKEYMHQSFYKPTDQNSFREINSHEFMQKLKSIEKETEKISADTQKICEFLDELVTYKKESENNFEKIHTNCEPSSSQTENIVSNTDIGLKNTENIEYFENTNIDDVLPLHNEFHNEGE